MRGFPKYRCGEVVPIRALGPALTNATTETLVRKDDLEIARIILRADERHAEYESVGHVVLLCLEGRVAVQLDAVRRELGTGNVIHLPPGTRHSLFGIVDSALLLVGMNPMRAPSERQDAPFDPVDEASRESFPASDPPAISSARTIGTHGSH